MILQSLWMVQWPFERSDLHIAPRDYCNSKGVRSNFSLADNQRDMNTVLGGRDVLLSIHMVYDLLC